MTLTLNDVHNNNGPSASSKRVQEGITLDLGYKSNNSDTCKHNPPRARLIESADSSSKDSVKMSCKGVLASNYATLDNDTKYKETVLAEQYSKNIVVKDIHESKSSSAMSFSDFVSNDPSVCEGDDCSEDSQKKRKFTEASVYSESHIEKADFGVKEWENDEQTSKSVETPSEKASVSEDTCVSEEEVCLKKKKCSFVPHQQDVALQNEDEYEHVTRGLIYCVTSFPGTGLVQDMYEDAIQGCVCKDFCKKSCNCSLQYGIAYENGKLKQQHFNKPIFECNDLCTCPLSCPNRVVQLGPLSGLKIVSIKDKGYGVITSNFIPKNSFVCEYAGEYIGTEEAKIRFSKQSDQDSNYILVIKEYIHISGSTPRITVIDPTVIGNIGRYLNHSCDPNLIIVPVRLSSMIPVASLFAVKDIIPGEELCYDYGNVTVENAPKSCSSSDCNVDTNSVVSYKKESQDIIRYSLECNASSNITNVRIGRKCTSEVKRHENAINETSLNLQKPCLCKGKNCRGYLPIARNIL
ncbi:hypothetical protein SK128_015861 [Halocaridina rubra]|uniref:Histone-lysine N-methyltransferase set-23 n=1 Tax=Halocaridina rubra TaxID=373956 RepID=A0AAN9A045_HALRR